MPIENRKFRLVNAITLVLGIKTKKSESIRISKVSSISSIQKSTSTTLSFESTYPLLDHRGNVLDIVPVLGKLLRLLLVNIAHALGLDQLDGAGNVALGRAEIGGEVGEGPPEAVYLSTALFILVESAPLVVVGDLGDDDRVEVFLKGGKHAAVRLQVDHVH